MTSDEFFAGQTDLDLVLLHRKQRKRVHALMSLGPSLKLPTENKFQELIREELQLRRVRGA